MHPFSTSVAALTVLAGTVGGVSASLPFDATFSSTPTPFQIQVDPSFIANIRDRVVNTRYVADDLGLPAFEEGPSLSNATTVGAHWVDSYNWTQQQATINRRYAYVTSFHHYRITKRPTVSNSTRSQSRRQTLTTPTQSRSITFITHHHGKMRRRYCSSMAFQVLS